MKILKVLNLYAGIGGNRKLWEGVGVIAIENNPEIAKIYQDNFPNDEVIIDDAHEFLLENFEYFDFIWSSPPCITHSTMAKMCALSNDEKRGNLKKKPKYPDMKLYEEIIFLQHYFSGKWVVENVKSFYEPLIRPQTIQRHYFWSNFHITEPNLDSDNIVSGKIREWENRFGFDLSKFRLNTRKDTILRNCVHPKLGLHILNCARKNIQQKLVIA